jgi:hypothetical protein
MATSITASHPERFQDDPAAVHAPDYVKKHVTSVRAMFNRGTKLEWLPHDFRPFVNVEPIRLAPKHLLESDLPTVGEVEPLLRHAGAFRGLDDLLQVYHATGARTHELTAARVGDFQPETRQLLLGNHEEEPDAQRGGATADRPELPGVGDHLPSVRGEAVRCPRLPSALRSPVEPQHPVPSVRGDP